MRPLSVLLINPNTSQWVTDRLAAHLGQSAGAALRVDSLTARFGASYIDSRETFELGAQAVLEAWKRRSEATDAVGGRSGRLGRGAPDAVLVGCFGDPGVAQLRRTVAVPVLGLAEAAIGEAHAAGRYAIVTGGLAWEPMLAELVASLGWADRLDNITVIEQSGGDLAADPDRALRLLAAACRKAAARGVERVVLGGAGFAGYGERLAAEVPVPVVDSVSAAARALLALHRSGSG